MKRALVCSLFTLSCGGSNGTEPTEPSYLLPLGTYNYTFSATHGLNEYPYSGTFTITSANKEKVTGTWDVAGFDTEIGLGFWNIDAYVLVADVDDEARHTDGLIKHRIALVGGIVTCMLARWLFAWGVADDATGVGTCTITGPI